MKALQVLKKIIVGIITVVFFLFAISITILLLNYNKYGVTEMGDTSFILIKEELSSDNYIKGDLVLVKSLKVDKINKGDEIFAYKIDSKGKAHIDLGIVENTYITEDAISFENGSTYSMEFVIGKASKTYTDFGTFLSIIESKWGFLFIILIPSFLIFIYQLYALIVEIKYGNEEEIDEFVM